MRCVWAGVSGAPSTSATYYNHVAATRQSAWNQFENNTGGFAGRSLPITDNIVITALTVWVGTAPGGSASWTFKMRTNGADSTVSAVITGAATNATWKGRVSFTAGELICLSATPASTPAGAVTTYWTIEYYTTGNYYLLPVNTNAPSNSNGTFYYSPIGGSSLVNQTTATSNEAVMPTSFTVTKSAAIIDQQASNNITFYMRNNTTATDSTFSSSISGANTTSTITSGTLTVSAGDMMVLKEVRTSSSWASARLCFTVVPSVAGEIVQAFGNPQNPSNSATQYNTPLGGGNGAWNATETSVDMRMPGRVTLQKLYTAVGTAPGNTRSRAFTLRINAANTVLTATISNTATAANNTTNIVKINEGDLLSVATTPTTTPTAPVTTKVGFVLLVHQPNGDFFSQF